MASRGPKGGYNCNATFTFSAITNKGDEINTGYITCAFSGASKVGEVATEPLRSSGFFRRKLVESLHRPCVLGDPQQKGTKTKWLHNPFLLGGSKVVGIAMQPLLSTGSPTKGIKAKVDV